MVAHRPSLPLLIQGTPPYTFLGNYCITWGKTIKIVKLTKKDWRTGFCNISLRAALHVTLHIFPMVL